MGKLGVIAVVLLIFAAGLYLLMNYQSILQLIPKETVTITHSPTTTVQETSFTATEETSLADLEYLERVHRELDPASIPELQDIIVNHPDTYVRERAVFVLTDIVIRSGERVDEVVEFLKEIAYSEKEDKVRTAAYANLDLIRRYYPLDLGASLEVSVEGEIIRGKNITLVFTVVSPEDLPEARVGIRRIVNLTSDTHEPVLGMLMSMNPVRFSLKAGEPRDARFTIYLMDVGEYLIDCILELNLDRVDYQIIKRKVYLNVGEMDGSYLVVEDLSELFRILANQTTITITPETPVPTITVEATGTISRVTTTTPTTTTQPTTTTTRTTTTPQVIEAALLEPWRVFFSSAQESKVYVYDYQYQSLTVLFEVTGWKIYSFSFHPVPEKVYYVDANSREIRLFLLGSGDYGTVYEHSTYVRCVRFRADEGRLYFSEAAGAGGGKIYTIVRNEAELYYEVSPELVDGSWAGDFDFGADGELYLSSGNTVPASIYVVEDGAPRKIATFQFPVVGIRYVEGIRLATGDGEVMVGKGLLLADWGSSIYLYDLESGTLYKIYENNQLTWLSDVAIRT